MSDNEEKNSSPNDEENEEPASRTNEDEDNNENKEDNLKDSNLFKNPFHYFEKISPDSFLFSLKDGNFENEKGAYKYCMCLLMKDDSLDSSNKLYSTLKGIENNLQSLKDNLNIIPSEIALFIFVKKTLNDNLFDDGDKNKLEEENQNFLRKEKTMEGENNLKNAKIYLITNYRGLYDMTALKCYYSILRQIIEGKKIFSSIITVGVSPQAGSLLTLIQIAYNGKNTHGIAVAPVEYIPKNIYSMIALYEKIHFNIFNMSLYDQSCSVPISSLFCTMAINSKILNFLEEYYEKIPENAKIDYHDYNLSLQLSQDEKMKYVIKFIYEKPLGTINCNEMSFIDYQKEWIDRQSGYYGNIFEILRVFINFKSFNILQKLFMFFQIMAIVIEYILPSLACMVIYAVFHECFNTYDYRVAMFFTLLYLSMMFCSGACSMITKETELMPMTNYFIYYFMIFFYALVLICSIPAMHFVNINKPPDLITNYKFNKAAASLLIILNFIFYAISFIPKMSVFISNFVSMIIYFVLGATCSTTNFNMIKVWNAPETSGGNFISEKKAINILIYLFFNLFFGSLSFYNVGRKKRVNCVMGFGILFLFYNFVRMLAILLKKTKERIPDIEKIKEGIKIYLEKDDDEEARSEEKNIKKSENEEEIKNNEDNDNDNDNYDNENQNEGDSRNQNEDESRNQNENDNENQNENDDENQNENENNNENQNEIESKNQNEKDNENQNENDNDNDNENQNEE